MTKRWSSTKSDLSKTKRQASKGARADEEEELRRVAEEYDLDPMAEFAAHLRRKYGPKNR